MTHWLLLKTFLFATISFVYEVTVSSNSLLICLAFNESFSSFLSEIWLDFWLTWPIIFAFSNHRIANFRIESNEFRTNPISENLTPAYSWSRIKRIEFEIIFIEVFELFLFFRIIESQIFESNRTNFERIPIWLHPYPICHLYYRCLYF